MMAEPAALLAPEMRRRVLEIRQGEEISLSGPGAGAVVVRMLEKSGRKVRVLVIAPLDVKIDTSKLSML